MISEELYRFRGMYNFEAQMSGGYFIVQNSFFYG